MKKTIKIIFQTTVVVNFLFPSILVGQVLQFQPMETWLNSDFHSSSNRKFLEDVNGDGKDDAIVANSTGVYVRTSNGTSFSNEEQWLAFAFDYEDKLYIADLNGDQKADLIWLKNENEDNAYVRLSNGATFADSWSLWLESGNM